VERLTYTKYVFDKSEEVEDLTLYARQPKLFDLNGGREGGKEGGLVVAGGKECGTEGGGQQQQQQQYFMLTCGRGPALGFYTLGGGGTFGLLVFPPSLPPSLPPSIHLVDTQSKCHKAHPPFPSLPPSLPPSGGTYRGLAELVTAVKDRITRAVVGTVGSLLPYAWGYSSYFSSSSSTSSSLPPSSSSVDDSSSSSSSGGKHKRNKLSEGGREGGKERDPFAPAALLQQQQQQGGKEGGREEGGPTPVTLSRDMDLR